MFNRAGEPKLEQQQLSLMFKMDDWKKKRKDRKDVIRLLCGMHNHFVQTPSLSFLPYRDSNPVQLSCEVERWTITLFDRSDSVYRGW